MKEINQSEVLRNVVDCKDLNVFLDSSSIMAGISNAEVVEDVIAKVVKENIYDTDSEDDSEDYEYKIKAFDRLVGHDGISQQTKEAIIDYCFRDESMEWFTLSYAINKDYPNLAKGLLEVLTADDDELDQKDDLGYTALDYAVIAKDDNLVREFIAKGMSQEVIDDALHTAVLEGDSDMRDYLMSKSDGALGILDIDRSKVLSGVANCKDLNVFLDSSNISPGNSNAEVVEEIIPDILNRNICEDDSEDYKYKIQAFDRLVGHESIKEETKEAIIDYCFRDESMDWFTLGYSINCGYPNLAKGILEKLTTDDDELDQQDDLGYTALDYAVIAKDDNLVKEIIAKGMSQEVIDDALHIAVSEDDINMIEYFIKKGADVQSLDGYGPNVWLHYTTDVVDSLISGFMERSWNMEEDITMGGDKTEEQVLIHGESVDNAAMEI